MKKVLIRILACVILIIMIAGIVLGITWKRYIPPQVIGSRVSVEGNSMSEINKAWFASYTEQLKGWKVPFSYRIKDACLDSMELLEDNYIQLNYSIWPFVDRIIVISNLGLISTEEKGRYQAQVVLKWEKVEGKWVVMDKLTPVQYQLMSPEMQEEVQESQTEHYKMKTDEEETYYIKDGVLYVTYDAGENFQEVPDGYEKICKDANGRYYELLPYNSYIVTPEFTGFVGASSVIYSLDQGKSWQESEIQDASGYKANTFLSRTEKYCYVTMAVDRSLGNDYYATYRTGDFKTWKKVNMDERFTSNLTCVYWSDDNTGYYAKGSGCFYLTRDRGQSYQEMMYPEAKEITDELGFNPFDTMERMYQEDGIVYMVVGQGDDGDYARDGKIIKALYQSKDGINFNFEKEITDTPDEAG